MAAGPGVARDGTKSSGEVCVLAIQIIFGVARRWLLGQQLALCSCKKDLNR